MKEQGKKKRGIVGKVIAFILFWFGLFCVPVGAYGTYLMVQEGYYLVDGGNLKHDIISREASEIGKVVLYNYVNVGEDYADKCAGEYECQYVVKKNGTVLGGNVTDDREVLWSGSFSYGEYEAGRYSFDEIKNYEITVYILKRTVPDEIAWTYFVADNSDTLRVVLPVMAVAGVILVTCSFVCLLCLAGGRNEENEPTAGTFGRIPTDVFTLLILLLGKGWFQLAADYFPLFNVLGIAALSAGYVLLFLIWSMSIAARKRAKTLWSGMVITKLWRMLKKLGGLLGELLVKLPLIWKTVVGLVVISLLELAFLLVVKNIFLLDRAGYVILLLGWLLERLLLVPFICLIALQLKKLQKAGRELAGGNVGYQVDTSGLLADLKAHGENLNCISEGVNKAVKERMKSEHFKTELITNVSHDIKTPLTSIINYSDLLCKEETDNEKIQEFADVLYRQSTRLKKLIEDLVEASKASTGSIEVNLEQCEVGVLLEQAQGEFEKRLYERNLDVIVKMPQEPVRIMADGKHLWRVFDNLFSNICKYGQEGTRVYLTVEEADKKAVITFKNISEYPLDISADELMERFVRGDKSRHTEGNGLGLNIARSLTELQNGTLDLMIDGDLFKVILTFPVVEEVL